MHYSAERGQELRHWGRVLAGPALLAVPAWPPWALTSTPVGSFGRTTSNPPQKICLASSHPLPHHHWLKITTTDLTKHGNQEGRTLRLCLLLATQALSSQHHRIEAHHWALHPPQVPPQHRTHPPLPFMLPSPMPTPGRGSRWTPTWPWLTSIPSVPSLGSSPHRT